MINRTSVWGRVGAIALVVGLVLALIAIVVGLWEILLFLVHLAQHFRISWSWRWLQDLYATADDAGRLHPAADKIAAIGALCTGAFTLMLVLVTRAMGRASQRQAAGDAPLLRLELSLSRLPVPPETSPAVAESVAEHGEVARNLARRLSLRLFQESLRTPENDDPYPAELAQDDVQLWARHGVTTPAVTTPRYVRLKVENVQTKPFAVARDIAVSVSLTSADFRGGMGHGFDPFPEVRKVEMELLPPNSSASKRVFDISPLQQFEVSVVDVEYRDLRGRKRRKAAYGQLTIRFDRGTEQLVDGYSRPERWEMP